MTSPPGLLAGNQPQILAGDINLNTSFRTISNVTGSEQIPIGEVSWTSQSLARGDSPFSLYTVKSVFLTILSTTAVRIFIDVSIDGGSNWTVLTLDPGAASAGTSLPEVFKGYSGATGKDPQVRFRINGPGSLTLTNLDDFVINEWRAELIEKPIL